MIWKALMKDGSEIYEYKDGKEFRFADLDQSRVNSFKIFESGNENYIQFSGDTGIARFYNFDIQKMAQLAGNEKLELVFDKDLQVFKLSNDSFRLYNHLLLKEESTSNYIGFDQTGKFNINGDELMLEMEMNGEKIEFYNQAPYNDIIHFKKANTEFVGKQNSVIPVKKMDNIEAYAVGYNKVHNFNGLQFKLSCVILYEVVTKSVTFNCKIVPSETVSGYIVLKYRDKESRLSATLMKDQPVGLERLITIL